ncbi:hypothetical protein JHQ56_08165 [Paenarthrobacter ureafaciens]|nr:hypothetical protein JHQ56_08165 [Paenarthrobacter ureafaciens]
MKPAENQTTTHGGAQWPGKNSTNQKTIGINKLGTLLSSQTTDTYRHHHQPKASRSLRSNFSNLPEPARSWQISVSAIQTGVSAPPGKGRT